MTTRDPRLGDPASLDPSGNGRDPTQSLSLAPEDEVPHPSLALGTHEARDEHTRVESPGARAKTPVPPAARAPTRPPPRPDDPDNRSGKILGSYKVLELLGKGGMGFVYRAEHVKLGREVALKLLRSDYAKRKDAVARFIQEARTVNRIRHRNIVDVPDILELDDGTTCIVMEFLRGQSLGKWARSGIDMPRALAVLVQICDGLSAAHAVDIVHRDLKPDNVIVVPTSDGAELVKLLDFGVAKLLNRDDEDIGFQTAAGSVIGTPAYMSPEQAGGMVIDRRSDIYSLGAIMYELFCGQPMFRGRSFGEYVRKHLTEMPVRPRGTQGGAEMDERLEAMILKCLEKDPDRRFGDIVELRDTLLHLLGAMDTHPPGFASLTASGLRPPPLPSPPSVGPGGPLMPIAPVIPMMPTPGAGQFYQSVAYGGDSTYGSAQYSQVVGLAPPPVSPPTPWWVWFVGGAVAVSLGIGAAVWYAGGDPAPARAAVKSTPMPEPTAPAAGTQPEPPTPGIAAALDQPIRPTEPSLVEVRFDSLPSGGVYEDGKSAELCRTPCTFNLELGDGARAERRFIVKADGYRDGTIDVDMTVARPSGRVTLEQIVQVAPVGVAPVVPSRPSRPSRPNRPARPAVKPVETTPVETTPVETKPPDNGRKPGDKIDRSETLDPFKRKRP